MAAPNYTLHIVLQSGLKFNINVPRNVTADDVFNAVSTALSARLGRNMPVDSFRIIMPSVARRLDQGDIKLSVYEHYWNNGNDVTLYVQPILRAYTPVNNAKERLANASQANRNRVSRVARNAAAAARTRGVAVNGGVSRKRKSRKSRKTRRN